MSKHKLVFGFGSGLIYSLGNQGKWRDILPKYLEQFDNDILVSAKDMPISCLKYIAQFIDTKNRLYIDSGGFTLYKDEKKMGKDNPLFHKNCEKMKNKLLKVLSDVCPKECFELDNEYFRKSDDLLSPDNYLRKEIKEIVGYYPTPVFKMHQGFEYWKKLCESDIYDRLSIGGFAQTKEWHKYKDELKNMMEYARAHNKKVHLLGCQNIETFKLVQPDTVDYSIFQYALNINEAKRENPEWNNLKNVPYHKISKHIALWALARAKTRTYFYDSYQISNEE